jgi:hypothetical protein
MARPTSKNANRGVDLPFPLSFAAAEQLRQMFSSTTAPLPPQPFVWPQGASRVFDKLAETTLALDAPLRRPCSFQLLERAVEEKHLQGTNVVPDTVSASPCSLPNAGIACHAPHRKNAARMSHSWRSERRRPPTEIKERWLEARARRDVLSPHPSVHTSPVQE